MKDSLSPSFADAVWQRIQFLVKSLIQYDAFAWSEAGDKSGAVSGHDLLTSLLAAPERVAQEFLLLSLRQALDIENYRLLTDINEMEVSTALALAEKRALPELILQERLSLLQQCGLVGKNYETGSYFLTPAGKNLVGAVQEMQQYLANTIREEIPKLLQKKDGGQS